MVSSMELEKFTVSDASDGGLPLSRLVNES